MKDLSFLLQPLQLAHLSYGYLELYTQILSFLVLFERRIISGHYTEIYQALYSVEAILHPLYFGSTHGS